MNNLLNKTFGKLTVIKREGTKNRNAAWLCRCECGNHKVISGAVLVAGSSKSCGCSKYESMKKHGLSESSVYKTWMLMKDRCANKKNKSYKDYGGRGITVCDRWINSFENFYSDMGDKPIGMSIERIDNNKGYSPDNCKWATKKQQDRNKRTSRIINYKGESLCVVDWAAKTGIPPKTLHYRLVEAGWSVDRALTEKVKNVRASQS